MNISKIEFIQVFMERLPSQFSSWFTVSELQQICELEYAEVQTRIDDENFGARFKLRCDNERAISRDYNYKEMHIASNAQAILSIRFKNMDLNHPFAEIIWANFDPDHYYREIVQAIDTAYSIFNPTGVRFHTFDPNFQGREDFSFYAETFEHLRYQPLNTEIRLTEAADLKWYEMYLEEYERLGRNPQLRGVISAESISSLEEALNHRMLYIMTHRDNWIGVIGAVRRRSGIYSGICMIEQLLSENYRGRGFAPGIQSRFAQLIPHQPSELLYGTIAETNLASIRTAEKLGRLRCSSMVFKELVSRQAIPERNEKG